MVTFIHFFLSDSVTRFPKETSSHGLRMPQESRMHTSRTPPSNDVLHIWNMFLAPIKDSTPTHIELQPCAFWLKVAVSQCFGDCMLFNVLDSKRGIHVILRQHLW